MRPIPYPSQTFLHSLSEKLPFPKNSNVDFTEDFAETKQRFKL
jgi:hypothetical protein